MRVAVGIGDGIVAVGVGRSVCVEAGVGDGLAVAIGAVVIVGDVVVGVEVTHPARSSKLAQMPKIKRSRVLFMPSVYNGFVPIFRRLPDACHTFIH
jgi:hypothetical protein